jgi:rubrerythrin
MDHFRINHDWQNLDIVVEGREVGSVYVPSALENANPFGSFDDLIDELRIWLAPLELTLIFEYLYARFSVRTSEEVKKHIGDEKLASIVDFVRYNLLLIATSEMHHLRWANELLWKLCNERGLPFKPVLEVCEMVPKSPLAPSFDKDTAKAIDSYVTIEHKIEFHPANLKAPTKAALAEFEANSKNKGDSGYRERALRPLSKNVISDFIALEHPSSFIDGAYARVIATLRQANYSPDLVDVATRIASEGMEHERHFIDINTALAPYHESEYLRPDLQVGTKDNAADALREIGRIVESLRKAYGVAGQNRLEDTNPDIAAARAAMSELLKIGEDLGSDGIGIPFFLPWESRSSGSSRR